MNQLKNNDAIPIGKEHVLALDIATHTGYYSVHESGTWNFTESKHRNDNKQHKDFRNTLLSFIKNYGILRIVAEDVNVNNHFRDAQTVRIQGDFARSL